MAQQPTPLDLIMVGAALLTLQELRKMTAATEALQAVINDLHTAVVDISGDVDDMKAKIDGFADAIAAANAAGAAGVDSEVVRLAEQLRGDATALSAKAAVWTVPPPVVTEPAPVEPAPVTSDSSVTVDAGNS